MAVSKIISIEINDYNTRLCEVSYNKKTPTVYNTLLFANPEGAVKDSLVIDRVAYAEEFKGQLRTAGIKCTDAVFVIASNKVLSREVTIPDMKDKLIAEYIEGEKESYFPMDISDHTLSYTVIDKDAEKKQIRLIVYAAPELILNSFNTLAAELGLRIVALDSSGNSAYQFLQRNSSAGIDFYLQINENNSLFTILENGKFALQRNMNFGTASLVEHLIDEGYYGELTKDQAVAKLESEELLYTSYSEMMEYMPVDEADAKLYECKKRLTDAIRPLIAGFTRVLEYYNTKNKEAAITKVYIGGCGSKLKNLDVLIMSEFEGIEIEVLEVLPNMKYSKKDMVMAARSTEFTSCLGASIRSIDFSKVALVEDKKGATTFAIVAGVVTVVSVIGLVGFALLSYKFALDKQEKLNEDIASLQKIADLRNELNEYNTNLVEIKEFDESTITMNEDFNKILGELEVMLPTTTLVSSITSNETALNMVLTIPSKEEASKLLVQLKNIPSFEDIQISTITENNDESTGIKNQSFTVTCTFPQPEETAPPAAADAAEEGTDTSAE